MSPQWPMLVVISCLVVSGVAFGSSSKRTPLPVYDDPTSSSVSIPDAYRPLMDRQLQKARSLRRCDYTYSYKIVEEAPAGTYIPVTGLDKADEAQTAKDVRVTRVESSGRLRVVFDGCTLYVRDDRISITGILDDGSTKTMWYRAHDNMEEWLLPDGRWLRNVAYGRHGVSASQLTDHSELLNTFPLRDGLISEINDRLFMSVDDLRQLKTPTVVSSPQALTLTRDNDSMATYVLRMRRVVDPRDSRPLEVVGYWRLDGETITTQSKTVYSWNSNDAVRAPETIVIDKANYQLKLIRAAELTLLPGSRWNQIGVKVPPFQLGSIGKEISRMSSETLRDDAALQMQDEINKQINDCAEVSMQGR